MLNKYDIINEVPNFLPKDLKYIVFNYIGEDNEYIYLKNNVSTIEFNRKKYLGIPYGISRCEYWLTNIGVYKLFIAYHFKDFAIYTMEINNMYIEVGVVENNYKINMDQDYIFFDLPKECTRFYNGFK